MYIQLTLVIVNFDTTGVSLVLALKAEPEKS